MKEPFGSSGRCGHCGVAGDYIDWKSTCNILQRIACRACGRQFRNDSKRTTMVYVPGEIETVKGGVSGIVRPLVWKLVRENKVNYVYFPCNLCGKIMKVPGADIRYDGVLTYSSEDNEDVACINCGYCHCHFWPWFEDFEPIGGSR